MVVDSETGEIVMELPGSGSPVFDIAFLPGGERLVNVSLETVTRVWDVSADGPPEWEALATRTGAIPMFRGYHPTGHKWR